MFCTKIALSCLRYKKSHTKEVSCFTINIKCIQNLVMFVSFFNKMDIFKLNINKINLDLKCGCVSVNFQIDL